MNSQRVVKGNRWEDYDIIAKVGEGTYGHVFKATRKGTNQLVALKKLLNFPVEEGGIPFTSLREIKFLKRLQDVKNVITLHTAFFSKDGELVLVFDWMEHDLTALISSLPRPLELKYIKCYMKQMLEALYEIHNKQLMHRDIKAANMLLNNRGQLFIADFGLMTSTTREVFSNNVITRWFKPPEILLGSVKYGPEVDMWGVGCVLVEMLTGKTPFPGQDDEHQLELILQLCGTEILHQAKSLPPDTPRNLARLEHFNRILQKHPNPTKSLVGQTYDKHPSEVVDLLKRLFCVDPSQRITATDALDHDFFWSGVAPANVDDMPRFSFSIHEYELKQQKKNHRGRNAPDFIPPPTKPGGSGFTGGRPTAMPFVPQQRHGQFHSQSRGPRVPHHR